MVSSAPLKSLKDYRRISVAPSSFDRWSRRGREWGRRVAFGRRQDHLGPMMEIVTLGLGADGGVLAEG